MSDIPEDIMEAARKVVIEDLGMDIAGTLQTSYIDCIAEAIEAERERSRTALSEAEHRKNNARKAGPLPKAITSARNQDRGGRAEWLAFTQPSKHRVAMPCNSTSRLARYRFTRKVRSNASSHQSLMMRRAGSDEAD